MLESITCKKIVEYNSVDDISKVSKLFNCFPIEHKPSVRFDPDLGVIVTQDNRSVILTRGCIIVQTVDNIIYILYHEKGVILN